MSPYARGRAVYVPNRSIYHQHYTSTGGGLPVFKGVYQDGSGLLSNIFRFALPILKSTGKTLLSSGVNALSDVMGGKDVKSAIKQRSVEGLKNVGNDMIGRAKYALRQRGAGGGRTHRATTVVCRKRRANSTKAESDIFTSPVFSENKSRKQRKR